jgi:hypothetical protein
MVILSGTGNHIIEVRRRMREKRRENDDEEANAKLLPVIIFPL